MDEENTGKHKIPPPTAEELSVLYDGLANNPVPVVLLSTVPRYADHFISTPDEEPNLPPLVSSLYSDKCKELSPLDLEAKCQEVFPTLTVTKREALYLEHATRKQNGCFEWFDHRVGRITASTAYAVVHTRTDFPSKSLIKQICSTHYNQAVMVPALEWGRNNKDVARKAYTERQTASHSGFSCSAISLRTVNPQYTRILGQVLMVVLTVTAVGRGF